MPKHVVIVRMTFSDHEWELLKRAGEYHGESARMVVETEARLGVEEEMSRVESGDRVAETTRERASNA